ncbi:MAG: hypothetical protein IKI11_05875 [Neisseriaceae bacterium]|nr:hypothetical protein [Neisseriaceae bacterium]
MGNFEAPSGFSGCLKRYFLFLTTIFYYFLSPRHGEHRDNFNLLYLL